MNKLTKKLFVIILCSVFIFQMLFIIPSFNLSNSVLADIDTLTYEDDFEDRYYNNIYSQYENATIYQPSDDLIIRPTGIGSITQLYPIGDTPNHNCVDDITPDEDTTRVNPLENPQDDTYQMADHTTETADIINVRIYIRCFEASGETDYAQTILRVSVVYYLGSANALVNSYEDYYTDYALNPHDSEVWEWSDIDNIEGGVRLTKNGAISPRCTQVYIVVTYETDAYIGSTTTYKQQETSFYRACSGLYSFYHNIKQNYTEYGLTVYSNSSIIVNFIALSVFPQFISFSFYTNFYFNISLFIGTQEYYLNNITDYQTINDWGYVGEYINREDYLITDVNSDFYVKIYPTQNDNEYNTFFIDDLKVKYTDREAVISHNNWCGRGEEYNDWVSINDTSSSFYAQGTGENPAGWLEDETSDNWRYRTASNKVISRGMTISNLWTLKEWEEKNEMFVFTQINFTIDREYFLYERINFFKGGLPDILYIGRYLYLYIDNVLEYEMYNVSVIGETILDGYYELSYVIQFSQLNERTMSYYSSFNNYYSNGSDWRPLIFPINQDIQTGLNIMNYAQQTMYQAKETASTNPRIFQKTSRDIHNTPFDDVIDIIDTETGIGALFRKLWDKISYYFDFIEDEFNFLDFYDQQSIYQQAIIEQMQELVTSMGEADWLENYLDGLRDTIDTFADGIVGTWRNLFSNNDFGGLGQRFNDRWGGFIAESTKGGTSVFTRVFGNIFGEDVGIIPQLIFQFFNNFRNWIVIFFVMYIVMLMRSIMKRDWEATRREIGFMMSVLIYIVKFIQWFIGFIIRILTMIGGFIPFT